MDQSSTATAWLNERTTEARWWNEEEIFLIFKKFVFSRQRFINF